MLSLSPRKTVLVTKTKLTIEVGDFSYLMVRGDGTNPKVRLTAGRQNGQLLLIEAAIGFPFTMVDNVAVNRTQLSATRKMNQADTMLLAWGGTRWVQVSYSKNHD